MLINVLSYNISWATQANKSLGSEKDFVEACKKEYKKGGKQCILNALENISKLPKLDLIGLQEVNSSIEEKIMKIQPLLKEFKRASIGVSNLSILWNPTIFGDLIYEKHFNLIKNDDRPCLILVLKNKEQIFILINLQLPRSYFMQSAIKILENNIIKNKTLKNYIFDNNAKIIMMGDFNDVKTTINNTKPIIIKNNNKTIKLKHNKTKKEAQKTLKTCCWHEPNHIYKYFDGTGDYILVNQNLKQKSLKIPEIFRKSGRKNNLFSDHRPVFSKIQI